MKWYCKLIGHTYVFHTETPRIAWNAGKDMAELHMTAEGEPRSWLECARCGDRIENPSRDEIRRANTNYRRA